MAILCCFDIFVCQNINNNKNVQSTESNGRGLSTLRLNTAKLKKKGSKLWTHIASPCAQTIHAQIISKSNPPIIQLVTLLVYPYVIVVFFADLNIARCVFLSVL